MEKQLPTTTLLGVKVPLKYVSLLVVVFQTSAMVLVLRASLTNTGDRYISSTAILLSECLKLITCLFLVYQETRNQFIDTLKDQVFGQGWDSLKIFVPACLYVVQNNLLFVALGKLDAATYQVTYQLKILTAAFFSVALLRKHLDAKKWGSLVILTFGVSLVQLSILSSSGGEDDEKAQLKLNEKIVGLFCIIGACLLSGLAGVYLERVLKYSKPSVWVRNIQLSLFSLIPGLVAVFWTDGEVVLSKGFFYGYTPLVWVVVVLQASSGLVVALALRYADNILKGFATSISIVVSSLVTMFLFSFSPSLQWLAGASLVISSTILYSQNPPSPTVPVLPTKDIPIKN